MLWKMVLISQRFYKHWTLTCEFYIVVLCCVLCLYYITLCYYKLYYSVFIKRFYYEFECINLCSNTLICVQSGFRGWTRKFNKGHTSTYVCWISLMNLNSSSLSIISSYLQSVPWTDVGVWISIAFFIFFFFFFP